MCNWFKNLFGGKCCCHKGKDCCQKEKHESANEVEPTAAAETAPKMPENVDHSTDSEVKTE